MELTAAEIKLRRESHARNMKLYGPETHACDLRDETDYLDTIEALQARLAAALKKGCSKE